MDVSVSWWVLLYGPALILMWFGAVHLIPKWRRKRSLDSESPLPVPGDPLESPVKYATATRAKMPRVARTWSEILEFARADPEKHESYRVVDIRVHDEPTNHQFLLNEMSSQGWILVTAISITSHTSEVRYIFRRKKFWGS